MISSDKLEMAREVEQALTHKLIDSLFMGNNAYPMVCGYLKPEHFSIKALGDCYREMLTHVETATIEIAFEVFTRHGLLEFLGNLYSSLAAGDIDRLGKRVLELHMERQLVIKATEVIALSNHSHDLPVSMKYARAAELFTHSEAETKFADAFAELEKIYHSINSSDRHTLGIPTGYSGFDAATNGLKPGKLYVFAGSPGMGKTICGLNITASALLAGNDVLFYSLEMTSQELMLRLAAGMCKTPIVEFERGGASAAFLEDFTRRHAAWSPFLKNFHIRAMENFGENEEATAMQIIADYRYLSARGKKPGLVVIDYLGLMEHGESKTLNLTNAIGKTTRLLKKLAGRWMVPVLLMAQVGKEVLKRPDARPHLSDLRDSGHIEQDADLVAFIYRDSQVNVNSELRGVAELIIRKNRSGPCILIPLEDRSEIFVFKDADANTRSLLERKK